MDNTKKTIREFLSSTKEASAKQIAKATGLSETEVANALNAMRTYADVECSNGGRGKGMIYWLATNGVDIDAAHQPKMPADKPCCNAAKVVATTAGSHVDELIKKLQASEKRVTELESASTYREGVIADLNAKLGHARIQIDALNEQLMAGEESVDIKDAARGYLVCAPKRKPAKLMKAESAVAKAKAAAKATGRGEVFALVPVGVATRKQVQAIEFKERAA